MKKEKCVHCQNIVMGEFTPSETRKWLTALAKKGGMKAVLTAAGSVVPGFGNVSGFIAGTAIDIIYGKDINKLIDYIADLYDDNKVYVFTCPNCGHTWSRKVIEDLMPLSEEDIQDKFKQDFNDYLEKVDDSIEDASETDSLSAEIYSKGCLCQNEIVLSQYLYLAGLCNLLRAKKFKSSKEIEVGKELMLAEYYFERAVELLPDNEYKLMLAAAEILSCHAPEECIEKGAISTSYYTFDDSTLFKTDWLIEIYDNCCFQAIEAAYHMFDFENENYNRDLCIKLCKLGLDLKNRHYRMICNFRLYLEYNSEEALSGKMPVVAARFLNQAFETEDYDIETSDPNNYFDREWLSVCIDYAESIIEDKNPFVERDVIRGLDILKKIADLYINWEDCLAKELACQSLGEYYEEGRYIEKNLSAALRYYSMGGHNEDVERLLQSTKTNVSGSEVSDNNEWEYLEELKSCLEDGEVSKGERRLLDKLRRKLGISDQRAKELEDSLIKPQLTDEEQEYLAEYRECFADEGNISTSERRLLNRLRLKLGISESRAAELEAMK